MTGPTPHRRGHVSCLVHLEPRIGLFPIRSQQKHARSKQRTGKDLTENKIPTRRSEKTKKHESHARVSAGRFSPSQTRLFPSSLRLTAPQTHEPGRRNGWRAEKTRYLAMTQHPKSNFGSKVVPELVQYFLTSTESKFRSPPNQGTVPKFSVVLSRGKNRYVEELRYNDPDDFLKNVEF